MRINLAELLFMRSVKTRYMTILYLISTQKIVSSKSIGVPNTNCQDKSS